MLFNTSKIVESVVEIVGLVVQMRRRAGVFDDLRQPPQAIGARFSRVPGLIHYRGAIPRIGRGFVIRCSRSVSRNLQYLTAQRIVLVLRQAVGVFRRCPIRVRNCRDSAERIVRRICFDAGCATGRSILAQLRLRHSAKLVVVRTVERRGAGGCYVGCWCEVVNSGSESGLPLGCYIDRHNNPQIGRAHV